MVFQSPLIKLFVQIYLFFINLKNLNFYSFWLLFLFFPLSLHSIKAMTNYSKSLIFFFYSFSNLSVHSCLPLINWFLLFSSTSLWCFSKSFNIYCLQLAHHFCNILVVVINLAPFTLTLALFYITLKKI